MEHVLMSPAWYVQLVCSSASLQPAACSSLPLLDYLQLVRLYHDAQSLWLDLSLISLIGGMHGSPVVYSTRKAY
jgi:hypothetical protein